MSRDQSEINNFGVLFMLYGPSTAGKTTLTKGLVEKDKEKPQHEQFGWKVDGQDEERDRQSDFYYKQIREKIKSNPESDVLFQIIAKRNAELIPEYLIFDLKIALDANDPNEDNFFDTLPRVFLKNFERDDIAPLAKLVHTFEVDTEFNQICTQIVVLESNKSPDVLPRLFDRTIERVIKGESIVLDMVSASELGIDHPKELKEHLESRNFKCPIHIGAVYVNPEELVRRSIDRHGDRAGKSDFRALKHLAYTFKPSEEETGIRLSREEVNSAAKNLNEQDGKDFIEHFFPVSEFKDEICVTPTMLADRVYDNSTKELAKENSLQIDSIARDLVEYARDNKPQRCVEDIAFSVSKTESENKKESFGKISQEEQQEKNTLVKDDPLTKTSENKGFSLF